MNEIPTATAGLTHVDGQASFLEDPYQKEIQLDIWQHEKKKTMQALFAIGLILLISNVIGLATANELVMERLLDILLFPILFAGLGLFARMQPMVSAIGGVIVILAITVMNYLSLGAVSLIAGWLYKALALYFVINSIRHAKEAEAAKQKLNAIG